MRASVCVYMCNAGIYTYPPQALRHIPTVELYERDRWRCEGAFEHLPVMYP